MKFLGIKSNNSFNNWYCNICNKSTNTLYIGEDRKYYCDSCLPVDKDKALIKYLNQNREGL